MLILKWLNTDVVLSTLDITYSSWIASPIQYSSTRPCTVLSETLPTKTMEIIDQNAAQTLPKNVTCTDIYRKCHSFIAD